MTRLSLMVVRAGGVLPLALGCALRDPYLLPVRGWALPAILIMAAAILCWRKDLAALLIWGAAMIVPIGLEARFALNKADVLAHADLRAQAVGRHFVVGYARVEDVEGLAAKGLIGGIFVGRHNAATAKRDITRLQALRRDAGLPPLLVAADQEGGVVSQLSPTLTAMPPLSGLAALPPNERIAAARRYGRLQGRELASLGITVNFSPVADLKGAVPRWDRNSLIARRAISSDPATAGEIAAAYADGLRDAGITPTAKHFPGLGHARGDTHHIRVRLSAPVREMEAADWLPFRQVLDGGPALLMVGHAILDAVDPVWPASQSHAVIDGIVRKQWGFTGGIITDDLTMPSVFHHDFCGGIVRTLDAGADFLLLSYDADQYYRAFKCALAWNTTQ